MDVSTVTTGLTGSAAAETSADTAPLQSSDFETFLKMLTTQAQNQDPFNPVDATEYASQLASFSAVEQQVMTNALLSDLVAMANGGGFERMASWIGLETLTPGAAFFDGQAVELAFDPAEDGESAVLVLRDADGVLRNRISLAAGSESYIWEGTDMSGTVLPDGIYDAQVEISREGSVTETREARSFMRIDEVSRSGEDFVLTLNGGGQLAASAVSVLRRPDG
ncbi:flagellar hook capping FlgD N-terminal domain-containing protein [Salipiger mangrovisoli]|uniref:Basal-body rod modification protein FlgD n=1 Tax=Salipiger mangrovisoli TaxID=2865933 RepID=A0ABR9WX79_9RHOB|nr:flagellar hook capping FlgD N-terminal domain-containing protein [Salipiger mangrovisoli]MBE9635895.1 flagellin biosynthesis protein FlgD [Salipiger mangrovisoli]